MSPAPQRRLRISPGQSIMKTILHDQLKRFSNARCCWISTVRPGSRPHIVPIWHLWHDSKAYVVTQSGSVKVSNLQNSDQVLLSLPDPMEVFVLEGTARLAPEMVPDIQPGFLAKYDWNIQTDLDYDTVIEIQPRKIFGWGESGKFRWTPPQPLPSEAAG